jgi:hypothetical protein
VTVAEIRSLADVRPGDICITRMGGLIPGLFPVRIGHAICEESFTIGPFSADHVLICVEASRPVTAASAPFGNLWHGPGGSDDLFTIPRAVQAMPRGAEEIELTPAKHWTDGVAWFRLTEDYPGQAEDAAAIARLFVTEKVPYSFLSYVALAAWSRGLKAERLERWIDRRQPEALHLREKFGSVSFRLPREAICSVLVDQAWSLAGKRVMLNVKRQCVTPGAMAIQLSKRYKAYGPNFLASA